MTSQVFKKRFALILLIAAVIASHLWLISFEFYENHESKKKLSIQTLNRPTIAALWSNSTHLSALSNATSKPEDGEGQNSIIRSSPPQFARKSTFSFNQNTATAQEQNNFLNSQKIREITIRNEQISMSASTQTALRELQSILFQEGRKSGSEQKNCCAVAAIQSQAICSTPELSAFYQNIFEPLRSRLENLAREGIKEFCE